MLTRRDEALLKQAARAHAQGDLGFAEAAYRDLVGRGVPAPQPYCNLAAICAQSERRDEAYRLLKKALSIDPRSLETGMGLASHYEHTGRIDDAKDLYGRIAATHPRYARARYMLANQHKAQGDFAEAMDLYRQILEKQPDYTPAHFNYSGIHKYRGADDPHILEMQDLLRDGKLPVDGRTHLSFALAKAFEDFGDYERAFGYLEQGNRLRRGSFHYDIESDAAMIHNIIETFNAGDLARLKPEADPSNRPIFIVGMVRSGTSLVEKILASHSQVYGAGELQHVWILAGRRFFRPELRYQFGPLRSYPPAAFVELGHDYLEMIAQLNSEAPRVTDKMPFNMMMIGLIRLALPNAKIIHCVRDARDTCLSIYRQNFATGNYRFAYDLQNIGRFYRLYLELMAHWHQVFPGTIYDISYEALVENPEPEIRSLLKACNLPWEDACLLFHKSPGAVRTASFYQVRQPMYRSSVQLWQKYEPWLQPLFDALEHG